MKTIATENCLFVLYEDSKRLVLEVECGTTAVYSIKIELTESEAADFSKRGVEAVRQLALDVQTWPDRYDDRRI